MAEGGGGARAAEEGHALQGGHVWQGACVARGVCVAGGMCSGGACMVGGCMVWGMCGGVVMHSRGHVWWAGVACMAAEMATAAEIRIGFRNEYFPAAFPADDLHILKFSQEFLQNFLQNFPLKMHF